MARKRSKLELAFETYWRQLAPEDAPPYRPEYRFALPVKESRFDFAWPERKIAVEIEGGTWSRGRHTRGYGFTEDCHKYNLAAEMGWRLLRYTSDMLSGDPAGVIEQIVRVLQATEPMPVVETVKPARRARRKVAA